MDKKLILVGGGGHARACIDVIERTGKFEIAGIFDLAPEVGKKVLSYEVIGTDDEIAAYAHKGYYFLVTVGQIKQVGVREKLFAQLQVLNARLATIISPYAYVSDHASIGRGSIVMHHALINAGAIVGDNCIINTGALVEHDSIVGHHNHISTRAVLNGGCRTGTGVFVGSGSIVVQNVEVAAYSVFGAGSIVTRTVPDAGVYVGNPIKRIN